MGRPMTPGSPPPRGCALPPLDPGRSALTGWTRGHWEAVADHLLRSVQPYATPGHARIQLPGRASWSGAAMDGLEGYARSFLLLAFRLAGSDGQAGDELAERYAGGLAAGTDPAGPEAWPRIADRSQQMVEAASIALALHESRPWIWDQLDPAVRERAAGWLGGMVGRRAYDNNWVLFQAVVGEFLASVGADHDRAEIEAGLDRVDEWYVADGWYQDGPRQRFDHTTGQPFDAGQRFDYYAGWALHLYTLLWARLAGPRAGDRAAVYRQRLRRFLAQYVHLFGADGAPVHYGRSLAYRFACLAPVWLGALCGATPLPPGMTRRLASGTLRHFVERGAPDQRGLLTLGWYQPFLPATQPYSGPGSPYWASKGFLGLLLPPGHPVWTDAEQALPVEVADQVIAMPAPGLLVHSTSCDGLVRVVNHGSEYRYPPRSARRDDPHYAKLAYSSATAPEAGEPAWGRNVDNHIALLALDGEVSRREGIHRVAVSGDWAASWHRPALGGQHAATCRIETASIVRGAWELRVHLVTAPRGWAVRAGGYALAGACPPAARSEVRWAEVRRPGGLASVIVALHGWAGAGVQRETGTNAFGRHSATPYLLTPAHPGERAIYACLVVLSGCAADPGELAASVEARIDGEAVEVRLPGGGTVQVQIDEQGHLRRREKGP